MFLIHLRALASDPLQLVCFVQVVCRNGTIEASCKSLVQTFFFSQYQSNTSMASLLTSHAPPPTFSVVSKPSNLSAHEPLTKKPKRSYDKSRIFQDS